MRREGKVRGKPTNHTKYLGKTPKPACLCPVCHGPRPIWKSLQKTNGMHKVKATDVARNYKLDQFTLKGKLPRRGISGGRLLDDHIYDCDCEMYDDNQESLDLLDEYRSPEVMRFTIASFLRGMPGMDDESVDAESVDRGGAFQQEVRDEYEDDSDSDCSWSCIDGLYDSGADEDGWYLIVNSSDHSKKMIRLVRAKSQIFPRVEGLYCFGIPKTKERFSLQHEEV
ncbi:hypothetical protein R1sor_014682 [Riccia sorocarpa]|uniref:Uncharacterized protein n=1 Tax=Riccia sorocarpa TaxID=122646 RepID=A0ABD3HAK5_9MARC